MISLHESVSERTERKQPIILNFSHFSGNIAMTGDSCERLNYSTLYSVIYILHCLLGIECH